MALKKALVVDDSATMRMLVGFALARYPECAIREASDGVEALAAMQEDLPDVLVCDINMPRMNGLELIKATRENPAWLGLPIVVITTEGSREDVRRGMSAGATAYLVKPFDPAKLHAILDHTCGAAV